MAFIYADRVKEQSSTVGLAAMVLTGALPGFQDFSTGVGTGNETFYTIFNGGDDTWEVGIGTFTAGSLSRDTVVSSSNSNNPVNFIAGTKTVFATVSSQFYGSVLDAVTHSTLNHTGIPGIPAAEVFTSSAHSLVDHTGVPFLLLDETAHDAVDHTAAPLNLMDQTAHDALDHTGRTGVNNFDLTLHGNTNHSGILGIPPPESFTNPVHAATNHSGIPGIPLPGGGKVVQQVRERKIAIVTCNAGTPLWDNSKPQQTEGNEVITLEITPDNLANTLMIEFTGWGGGTSGMFVIVSLHRDALADSLSTVSSVDFGGGNDRLVYLRHYLTVPTLDPQTYKINIGGNGTFFVNGFHAGTPLFDGVGYTSLTITEIAP